MTLPFERTMSVCNTKDFLRRLLDPKQTPKVPKAIRKEAYRLLRHYPADFEMEAAAATASKIFGPVRDLLSKDGYEFDEDLKDLLK